MEKDIQEFIKKYGFGVEILDFLKLKENNSFKFSILFHPYPSCNKEPLTYSFFNSLEELENILQEKDKNIFYKVSVVF